MEWKHARVYLGAGFLLWFIASFFWFQRPHMMLPFGIAGAVVSFLALYFTEAVERALVKGEVTRLRYWTVIASRLSLPLLIGIAALLASISIAVCPLSEIHWSIILLILVLHQGLLSLASFLLARCIVQGNIFLIGSQKGTRGPITEGR